MAEPDNEPPVVNVAALRRDIYRLIVLLLADERVAEVGAFRDLADSESNHESEVSRLLIWVAIATRQLLDIKEHYTSGQACGRFCRDYPRAAWRDLTFRTACNAVIHAVEIVPYDLPEDEVDPRDRARYTGTITIRVRGHGKRVSLTDMPTNRTAYRYHFKLGNRIVHTGITSDIDRREAEHQRDPGWEKGHIFQIGNRTTRVAALEWEKVQRKKGKPTGP